MRFCFELLETWIKEILTYYAENEKKHRVASVGLETAKIAALQGNKKRHVLERTKLNSDEVKRTCVGCRANPDCEKAWKTAWKCFGCGDTSVGNFFYCNDSTRNCFWLMHPQLECPAEKKQKIKEKLRRDQLKRRSSGGAQNKKKRKYKN